VGGPNFEYAPAKPEMLATVARVKANADRYRVSMKAAGLQFARANATLVAVIPGASRPSRIREDREALDASVPAEFWRELREKASSTRTRRCRADVDQPIAGDAASSCHSARGVTPEIARNSAIMCA
jgi:diketogulonate reductase-like aldo/keto reductase